LKLNQKLGKFGAGFGDSKQYRVTIKVKNTRKVKKRLKIT